MSESGRMQSLPALTVVVRQSVTGMNPPNVHGVMLTACSIRAMFTANVRELNVITVAFNKSQHLLNDRTAAIPICHDDHGGCSAQESIPAPSL